MAKKRKKGRRSRSRKSWSGCGCPSGATKVSTKGHGRGWVCVKKVTTRSRMGGQVTVPRFVKASC